MESKKTVIVKHHTRFRVTEKEIRNMLNMNTNLGTYIPGDAKMTITVPSGGDYSGDTLELDEVGGLTIEWTTEIRTQEKLPTKQQFDLQSTSELTRCQSRRLPL